MTRKQPVFDYSTCMACGMCRQVCPTSSIEMDTMDGDESKKAYPRLNPATACPGCVLCTNICPEGSIRLQEMQP